MQQKCLPFKSRERKREREICNILDELDRLEVADSYGNQTQHSADTMLELQLTEQLNRVRGPQKSLARMGSG